VILVKQAGTVFIEGTLDNLTFDKMDGKYYVRMKSSLTGKKFWKHKAFERSRESCKRFAEGNQLASRLYRMIEKEKRKYKVFCFLKKRAILLLKEASSLTEIEEVLTDYLRTFELIEKGKEEAVISDRPDNFSVVERSIPSKNDNELDSGSLIQVRMKNPAYAWAVGPPKVMGI